MTPARWQIWIDRGGTFTDMVARRPDGALADGPLPRAHTRIGTTVATNALLERLGEPVPLLVTHGFADALLIGPQARSEIFAREIVRPAPLHPRVVEVDERVTAEGEVLPPGGKAARAVFQAAYDDGMRAVAIALTYGYRHRAHETPLAKIHRAVDFAQVSVRHEASPLIRLIPRASTTVADAYLSPVLARYVAGLGEALGEGQRPLFMQTSSGLVGGASFRSKGASLSGPAGRLVGKPRRAEAAGFARVMRAAILSNRRRVPPFGVAGGRAGVPGANRVERAVGDVKPLGSAAKMRMRPGDVFASDTPGGGGRGARG